MSEDILLKAKKQEEAKAALLVALANGVARLFRDKDEGWAYREADYIDELSRQLEAASK